MHFQQLDDVSIDYAIKRLQQHDDIAIRFLTTNLMHRNLHKVMWSDTPLRESVVNGIRHAAKEKYGWPEDRVDDFIWTGSEINTMYIRKEESEIQILSKDGSIKPYSSFLQDPMPLASNKKYYICHPKVS